jgi:hypothetical protein
MSSTTGTGTGTVLSIAAGLKSSPEGRAVTSVATGLPGLSLAGRLPDGSPAVAFEAGSGEFGSGHWWVSEGCNFLSYYSRDICGALFVGDRILRGGDRGWSGHELQS